jgi:hypothetical protein
MHPAMMNVDVDIVHGKEGPEALGQPPCRKNGTGGASIGATRGWMGGHRYPITS